MKRSSKMDLDSMKYAELRSLAKELGLKANVKADKLLKALKQHYENQKQQDERVTGRDALGVEKDKRNVTEAAAEQEETDGNGRLVFVNTRRGRMNRMKRRISHAEPVAKFKSGLEVVESANAKRRRGFPARDSHETEVNPPQEPAATAVPHIKDEAPVSGSTDASKLAKGGRIPRYEPLQKRSKAFLNPATPNFKKLHEAHFNKMESIDTYFQRKTKQMESYKNAVKEVKMLSDKTAPQHTAGEVPTKPNPSRTSLFSPVSTNKKPAADKRRRTALADNPTGKDIPVFRPSVLSTRHINVRFSQATCDNEKGKSAAKLPACLPRCVASSTPHKQSGDGGKPRSIQMSILSATKTPAPFIFTANSNLSTTPGTQKKHSFDLKESLSRPLTYKPHKGKLKPFGEPKENTAVNKSTILESHQKNYKQHKVQARETRRAKQAEDRKQKKEKLLGARRGLAMM